VRKWESELVREWGAKPKAKERDVRDAYKK